MPTKLFKMPPQIFRLVLLTIGIIVSYLIARAVLTPKSFGEYGWYRGDALDEAASHLPVFAGKLACAECHSYQFDTLSEGQHKTLSCESCHGVGQKHAGNPDILPEKLTGSHCIRCHGENISRPEWFKQIVVGDHYEGKCTECHIPHNPTEAP